MPNPIEIERHFQNLAVQLKHPASAVKHLFEINRFMSEVGEETQKYESYLIELFQNLPPLCARLKPEGVNPDTLASLYILLNELYTNVEALRSLPGITEALKGLARAVSDLYRNIGEVEKARAFSREQDSNPVAKRLHKKDLSVSFPVVERPLAFEVDGEPIGLLRTVRVNVLARSRTKSDSFHADVPVVRSNSSLGEPFSAPLGAARKFLAEKVPRLADIYFTGQITFDEPDMMHEGSSAHLAVAVLVFCGILSYSDVREQYFVQPSVVITGDVDADGKVLAIKETTLSKKIEAAFFSRAGTLVVPRFQLERSVAIVELLTRQYVRRRLQVLGVTYLEDLFFDRRITDQRRAGRIQHLARMVWKKKFSLAGIGSMLMLLFLAGRLIHGPIDRNPVAGEFAGEILRVKNKYGETIDEIRVGSSTVVEAKSGWQILSFADVNGDGINDVIWGEMGPGHDLHSSWIKCRSISGDTLLWASNLHKSLHFPNKPDIQEVQFLPSYIAAGDFNNDGKVEVVAVGNSPFFASIVIELDGRTGIERGHYINTGSIVAYQIEDLKGDGIQKILLGGTNNGYRTPVFIVLDPRCIKGRSPVTQEYTLDGYDPGNEVMYMLIGRTIVGDAWQFRQRSCNVERISIDRDAQVLSLQIQEVSLSNQKDNFWPLGASYVMKVGYDGTVLGFGTNDDYDLMAEKLLSEKKISMLPDANYFENFKRTIKYWNGDEWQNKPMINRRYLEAIRETRKGTTSGARQ